VTEVRPATLTDLDACANLLARAFQDDPGAIVFDPDPARRRERLPGFFRSFVAAGLAEAGGLVVAGDPVAGIACWFGPDQHGPSEEAMDAHGFGDVLESWGPDASRRILTMVDEIEVQHDRRIAGPHFRLDFFGVDPERQGTGIGSALIEHGHRIADDLGLPCYLETFTEANVRYYERRGYAVSGEYPVGDGVPVYAMVRG
jgi:GNAT superfamily N-acetyltransferase